MRTTVARWLGVTFVWLAACALRPTGSGNSLVLVTDTPAAVSAAAPTPFLAPSVAAATQGNYKQWPAPPEMAIDANRIYIATLKTEKGDIKVELLADKAPRTVNNFIFLARQGFYDNTTFHRVLSGFMAQGGDPTGTGSGGPGYEFADEFHPDLRFEEAGLLAMANSGPDTNGSQFFITYAPTPHLTGAHTILGKVVAGMDVALALTERDPDLNPTGPGDRLQTVTIEAVAQSLLPPPTAAPFSVKPVPAPGRPLADKPIDQRADLYNTSPDAVIERSKSYVATIETTKGDIVVALYPDDAPASVNDFVVLAELGYWDNFPIIFVEPATFVLTGSPAGRQDSDVGYTLPPEVMRPNTTGGVGFWYRTDRQQSSGSQFYILLNDATPFDGTFTVFGAVTAGLDVAAQLTVADEIEKITIAEK